jgi:hypothetical protein
MTKKMDRKSPTMEGARKGHDQGSRLSHLATELSCPAASELVVIDRSFAHPAAR